MKQKLGIGLSLVLFCAALMFSGCLKTPGAPAPAEDTAARDAAIVETYIQTYENFVSADAPNLGADPMDEYLAVDFAFGALFPERESYLDADDPTAIVIPASRLIETARLFFGFPINGRSLGSELYYSADTEPNGVTAVLTRSETAENGDIRLTVERKHGDSTLFPAVYTFRKASGEEHLPEELARFEIDGAHYQFVSIKRLTYAEAGMPTEGETIRIRTPEQLVSFAESVNSGDWRTRFNTYLLEEDLDLAGISLPPIGVSHAVPFLGDPTPNGFCGVFDGQGHTISNFTASGTGELGFFSRIGEGGKVKNLTLENVSVAGSRDPDEAYTLSGGFVALVSGGTGENCRVTGRVEGYHAGGFAGGAYEYSVFSGCSAEVAVTGTSAIGGFCGNASMSNFTRCRSEGSAKAAGGWPEETPNEVGGFTGSSNASSYAQCISDAAVGTYAVSSGMAGAFAGYHSDGDLTGCVYNTQKAGMWKPIGVLVGDEGHEIQLEGRTAEEIESLDEGTSDSSSAPAET